MTAADFEHIARELRPCLVKAGRDFFGDADKAEDVAQEVLLRLWVMRDRIDTTVSPQPLALRMAKNVCVSLWRHDRHSITDQETAGRGAGVVATSTAMEDEDNARMLRLAIERLPKGERRLMRMRSEEGMDIGQIAAVTGLNPRSISVMLSRARQKIMETLKKGGNL